VRNAMMATFFKLLWQRLATSRDPELAAIAGKAVKEARYHQQHAADWVVRLGDGTPESRSRTERALQDLWPYTAELFAADEIDEHAAAGGIGPRWSELEDVWRAEMDQILGAATLAAPAATPFLSSGKQGRHSEHMGRILAELQYLQRAYPGGTW
jgi:ring-1,2-phenylacetyl-CoA epoxidase subunit PaaC